MGTRGPEDAWTTLGLVALLTLQPSSFAGAQTTEGEARITPQHSIEVEGAVAHTHRELWPSLFPVGPSPDPPARPIDQVTGGVGAYARLRAFTFEENPGGAWLIDVDLGWRFWAGPFTRGDGSPVCCRLLNPYVGASVGWEDQTLRGRLGAGMTLPLTNVFRYDGSAEGFLWQQADAAFGYRDGWMAMGETMAAVVRVDVEARWSWLRVRGEAALAVLAPVLRDDGATLLIPLDPGGPFTRYQFFVSVSGVVDPFFELGARVGLAGWAGIGENTPGMVGLPEPMHYIGERRIDEAQVSAMPFARVRFSPGYLEARVLVLLDDPNGLLSETTHLTFSLAAGLELE